MYLGYRRRELANTAAKTVETAEHLSLRTLACVQCDDCFILEGTSLRPRLRPVTRALRSTGTTPWTSSLLGAAPPNPCRVFSNCANFSMLVSFFNLLHDLDII